MSGLLQHRLPHASGTTFTESESRESSGAFTRLSVFRKNVNYSLPFLLKYFSLFEELKGFFNFADEKF